MPVSAKLATAIATAALTWLVAYVVAHFGLDYSGQAQQIVTTVIALSAGAFGGWVVKEEQSHPELVKRVEVLEQTLVNALKSDGKVEP